MASARRIIDRSTAQPFQPDEDFSQALPEDFDDAAFDQDVRRTFEEAETSSDFLSQARLPDGIVDRQRDAEIVPAGRDLDGRMRFASDDGSQIARLAAGKLGAVSVRRCPDKGGVRIEASFPGGQIVSDVFADDAAADVVEGIYREMAQAGTAEMARRGFVNVHLDPRLGSAEDRAALAAKHARRA